MPRTGLVGKVKVKRCSLEQVSLDSDMERMVATVRVSRENQCSMLLFCRMLEM